MAFKDVSRLSFWVEHLVLNIAEFPHSHHGEYYGEDQRVRISEF